MERYLIGIDLDGTPLNSQKGISQYTKKILQQVMEQGHVIVPVTGRPSSGLPKEVCEITDMKFAITSNGATVLEWQSGMILEKQHLTVDKTKEILHICGWSPKNRKFASMLEVFIDGIGYLEEKAYRMLLERYENTHLFWYVQQSRRPVSGFEELFFQTWQTVEEVSITCLGPKQKQELIELLAQEAGIQVISSAQRDVEVTSEWADKGKALLWLGDYLGIRRDRILAFGDSDNDISMLQDAAVSYAMANATEQVKKIATFQADSNDADGVAKVLACKFGEKNDTVRC